MAVLALIPNASAGHNVCDNESEDLYPLGLVGIDGPPLSDGNGEQVCIGDAILAFQWGPAPDGVGAGTNVCFVPSGFQACPAGEVLGFSGASVGCSDIVCVWWDGSRV